MSHPPRLAAGRGRALLSRGTALTRRAAVAGTLQALALLAACTSLPAPLLVESKLPAGGEAPSPSLTPTPVTPQATAGPGSPAPSGQAQAASPNLPTASCIARLPAAIAPTPVPYPGTTQKEPETGLHVTGPAHVVDLAAYRLEVTGKVARPLSLTLDELRCLPRTAADVVLECPGFFFDPQRLAGPTIATVLGLAGPQAGAETIRFSAVDGYTRDFPLVEAQVPENFLAYEWNGQLLPASHGFPLRGVMPARQGSTWMKWLLRIELV
jgi:DMSO/TMAO reductase YedYZ molybdopterin-dependent catalytic subunit